MTALEYLLLPLEWIVAQRAVEGGEREVAEGVQQFIVDPVWGPPQSTPSARAIRC